jgi:hypothetical protein
VIIIAVVLVVVLTNGGDDTDNTATTTTATTTTSSSASSSSEGTTSSSEETTSSSSGSDSEDELLSILPVDFSDCGPIEVPGDGATAAVECGAAATQPGPEAARFYLYDSQSTLDSVFEADATTAGVAPIADGQDCSTAVGSGTWTAGGVPGGQVGCGISPEGYVFILWTDDEYLTEGIVRLPGSTQAEVATLYDWWINNSNYN